MKKKKKPQLGLPDKFIDRLQECCGVSVAAEVQKSFVERPTTFRINHIKAREYENIKANLSAQGFKIKKVSWYPDAFILENKSKRELTETQEYLDGNIYIQSLASMVPPIVLDPKPGEKVLDLTAAPGSKTSQIAMMMQGTGELVANDVNKVRFFKLMHNMAMLGVSDANTQPHPRPLLRGEGEADGDSSEEIFDLPSTGSFRRELRPNVGGRGWGLVQEPQTFQSTWNFRLRMEHGSKLCKEYPEYFDKILLDAPCSAEARFVVGKPKTLGFWSERKIKEMAYTQRQLMLSAWGVLKPGGVMVYSTCTLAPEENEMQVSRLLERNTNAELIDIELPELKRLPPVKEWKGKVFDVSIKKTFRIMPTKEIEGFFVAKIFKKFT